MLCSILVVFSGLSFSGGFWLSILVLIIGLCMVCIDFVKCFTCFDVTKKIDKLVEPVRAPLIKGPIYIVLGIIIFKKSILVSILVIVCGVFYVGGHFFDKKNDGSKAPMV